MHKLSLLPFFYIQIFGEGAGGAGGGTGAGGDAGGAPAAGQNNAAPAQPQKGVKGNPLAGVQYGKAESAPAAGVQPTQINTDERTARFEELIKGEFKDLYDARVQDTIQKRLKGNEAMVQKYQAISPVLDLLAGKYGVDANDAEALSKAIEDDESFYEDEALEKGISVEEVKRIRKIERENKALKDQMERSKTEEQAKASYAAMMQEAEKVKAVYNDFDLETELQNKAFRDLYFANIPLQTAYEVIHKDELIPAALRFTAQQASEKVANSIRAGQRRPQESAMQGGGPVQRKSDVSQLTKADRAEIARRVARGERIVF